MRAAGLVRITLKKAYADGTIAVDMDPDRPTNEEQRVYATVRQLLRGAWTRKRPLRLVGVALSTLSGPSPQLDLFGAESRSHAIGPAIDAVRARFGYDAIRLGAIGNTRWLEQRPVPTRSPPDDDENPPGDPDLE